MNKLAFIALVALSTNTIALGDAAKGQAKAATCIACHMVDGNSIAPMFPKLAGQSQGYLLKQLQNFKKGLRKDATMDAMILPLSEEDMVDISAYFSAQKVKKGTAKKDANLALGEQIYKGGKKDTQTMACIACHGPNGKGISSAKFPQLASQHSFYTAKQLKDFRQESINTQLGTNTPARTNGMMMKNISKDLTNAEIEALAEYIANL